MSDLVLFRSANHWLSDERLSDERKGKFKKFSGERIANLKKMSECPALIFSIYFVHLRVRQYFWCNCFNLRFKIDIVVMIIWSIVIIINFVLTL